VSDAPRFSLVIPAYNEEACLPRLLDSVDCARGAYAGGAGAIEVIVADDGSTDATARRYWYADLPPAGQRLTPGAGPSRLQPRPPA
jgi:hypothetical protein